MWGGGVCARQIRTVHKASTLLLQVNEYGGSIHFIDAHVIHFIEGWEGHCTELICSAPSQPPCVCVTGQAPYTCNLGVLSKLGRLRSLDFAVTAQLRLPLSVKLVSTLALSWPHLTVSAFLLTHLQIMHSPARGSGVAWTCMLSLLYVLDWWQTRCTIAHSVQPSFFSRGLQGRKIAV